MCIGVTWGDMEWTLFSLDCQIKMRFCFFKTLLIEEPERDVKEGSVYCKSLYRGSTWRWGILPGNIRDTNIGARLSWTQRTLRVCKSGGNMELQ